MNTDQLRSGLAQFASDLTLAGQPIALDVVVARHLPLLREARAAKLRWSGLARLLAEAGARRPDGNAISADQLRASFSRAARHLRFSDPQAFSKTATEMRTMASLSLKAGSERDAVAASRPNTFEAAEPPCSPCEDWSERAMGPEPTDNELAAVRARLARNNT
ncbi:hypothetical protein [Methylobacterium sp. V23]|uniref:hypothetical protein n=1 Tax=Methylobacterium sp. V23 TaxID=2044878 RepID=UPI0011B06217|nr:hypothetical protein [Methylobacterium sp. V23]